MYFHLNFDNPSYLGGEDWEDHDSSPAQGKAYETSSLTK
jgi:hypothetical protein